MPPFTDELLYGWPSRWFNVDIDRVHRRLKEVLRGGLARWMVHEYVQGEEHTLGAIPPRCSARPLWDNNVNRRLEWLPGPLCNINGDPIPLADIQIESVITLQRVEEREVIREKVPIPVVTLD
jgi:hypothetical protein